MNTPSNNGFGHFVGAYAEEMKQVCIAGFLAGVHVVMVGGPGLGKTRMARAVTKAAFGDNYVMTRFNPTTPTEKMTGYLDVPAFTTKSEWNMIVAGTPYQKSIGAYIADEFGRPSDAVYDILMDVMDRLDIPLQDVPSTICTANSLPDSARTEALLDRIGLYYHVPDVKLDPIAVGVNALAAMNSEMVVDGVPDAAVIYRVRHFNPGPNAVKCVSEAGRDIANTACEGLKGSDGKIVRAFGHPNPRRMTIWNWMLYRLSAFYQDAEDFNRVSPEAMDMIKYAWATKTPEEARDWAELVGASLLDPVTAAIETAMKYAYAKMKQLAASITDRRLASIELGKVLNQEVPNILALVGGDDKDERYLEAHNALLRSLSEFVRGPQPQHDDEPPPF